MEDTTMINQISYDLNGILQDSWHRMINGTIVKNHPFRSPSIATVENYCPIIRTVALRKALATEKTLIFHTDYRSPKLNQIIKNDKVSWLFYDQKAKIQLRIKTKATVHYNDEITLKHWYAARSESKKTYLVQPAPSVISDVSTDGLSEFKETELSDKQLDTGYQNFAVIKCMVKELDWLYLNKDGHRRAKFIFQNDTVKQYWLVP
jgi:pyridoxamine 5'-phosphate oxidase